MRAPNPRLMQNCAAIFIDHQPQMMFGVTSIDRQLLVNNVIGLAKAAKIFKVPVILTCVESKGFSGYIWPQLIEVFPDVINDALDQIMRLVRTVTRHRPRRRIRSRRTRPRASAAAPRKFHTHERR